MPIYRYAERCGVGGRVDYNNPSECERTPKNNNPAPLELKRTPKNNNPTPAKPHLDVGGIDYASRRSVI